MYKLKLEVSHGYYLVRDWDDVFSIRVCVTEKRAWLLHPYFNREYDRLWKEGKLSELTWIDDQKHKLDDLVCITRRWAKGTLFIPNEVGNET